MDNMDFRKKDSSSYVTKDDDDMILCRCEEVTKGDIRKALYDGMRTMNEIKRYTRSGMGLCQGQTCSRVIRNFVASELGISPKELDLFQPRTPVRPVPMKVIAHDGVMPVGGQNEPS